MCACALLVCIWILICCREFIVQLNGEFHVCIFVVYMHECIYRVYAWIPTTRKSVIPYSREIWRGIKFGGLAVCLATAKLKSTDISYLHIIHMAIPYRTAKFKSANIFAMGIWGPTAKFNSCQYSRLYGILFVCMIMLNFLFTAVLLRRCSDSPPTWSLGSTQHSRDYQTHSGQSNEMVRKLNVHV